MISDVNEWIFFTFCRYYWFIKHQKEVFLESLILKQVISKQRIAKNELGKLLQFMFMTSLFDSRISSHRNWSRKKSIDFIKVSFHDPKLKRHSFLIILITYVVLRPPHLLTILAKLNTEGNGSMSLIKSLSYLI